MDIDAKQLKGKPRKVGDLDGNAVFAAETKGGLHFIAMKKADGKTKTLGAGSHPAVARNIAEKSNPTLKITELSKSESLDPYTLRREVERCLPITRRMQALES